MKYIFSLLFSITCLSISAQKFSDYFENKTLRLDYIFGGNKDQQSIYLSELIQMDGWNGRKGQLSKTPIQGNGQVKVYDVASGKLIYVLPCSSLFQEWLTQEEAKTLSKSFENTYLVPFPKKEAKIQVSFFNTKNEEKVLLTHVVKPNDILIRKAKINETPFEVIHKATVPNPIKVAIVAEGYQVAEMDQFMKYAKETVKSLFNHAVFKKYESNFEITAIKTPSKDSGVSQPSENNWKSTAVQSNFDTFYSKRYLTTAHLKQLHNWLENMPYQHIIILANTDIYGGGGVLNSYTLTTTKNKEFAPVVVHEFGHSFGGLGDEYFYPNDIFDPSGSKNVEPWEKNVTSLANFKSKWEKLIKPKTPIPTPIADSKKYKIGAYEGLEGNKLYIPTLTCRMKINNTPDFCQVCSNALEEMILFYTSKEEN